MRIDTVVGKITRYFHLIGAILLALMNLDLLIGVVARQLGIAILGLDEIGAFTAVPMTFFGIAYVLRQGRHIRVEILTERLNPRVMVIVDWLTDIIMLVIGCLLIWKGWEIVLRVYMVHGATAFLRFPTYIIKLTVVLGMVLFVVEVCCHIARINRGNLKT